MIKQGKDKEQALKIIQLNASYKPAYIYGGPTMSVSRLCEVLRQAQDDRQAQRDKEQGIRSKEQGPTEFSRQEPETIDLEVLTTTANGQFELDVEPGKQVMVDGVPVTYFRRFTKDHTHFSPGLLAALWKRLKRFDRAQRDNREKSVNNREQGIRNKEQGFDTSSSKPDRYRVPLVHIHAWWNLVSVLGCLVAVLQKTPVVLSPRGTLGAYSFRNRNDLIKKLIHTVLGKPLLKRCHFHVTSEKEKQDILKLLNPKSITVIPNLVKLSFDPEASGLDDNGDPGTPGKGDCFVSRNDDRISLASGLDDNGDPGTPGKGDCFVPRNDDRVSLAPGRKEEGIKNKEQASFDLDRDDRFEYTQNEKPFRLLFFSRVEQKKGLEILFEALKDIKADFSLTIAGTGEENYIENLKDLSKSFNLDKKIFWIGQQAPESKFRIMQDHDIMVLPSYDENFANVVVESLSVGTAVLLTENVGLSDYVAASDLGWICKANSESLKAALSEAMAGTEKLAFIRRAAAEKIREDFNDEKLANRYLDLYYKVLEHV